VHTADAARGVEAAAVEQWLLHSGVLERTPLLSELRSTNAAAAAATSDDEGDESDVWTGRGSSGRYDCGQSDCSKSFPHNHIGGQQQGMQPAVSYGVQ
jgi:hypothetical protein